MRDPMPYPSGEIRKWLLQHEQFLALLQGGVVNTSEAPPDPLVKPHVTVAVTGHVGTDPMLRRLVVQVTPWAPTCEVSGLTEDPRVTVWNLAATAGELLGRARNIVLDDKHAWSATWLDGPVELYDTKRGADRPLFYAPVRFQVHLRRR
ncbi:hypothetical protein [Corynebacterium sp. H113]|uniref:hypothetical protein n=1 Tax=Corynebacterium sp. H113 TaxID=3133419 RepID=UPI0030A144ED